MLEASAKAQEAHQGIYNDDAEAAARSIRDVKEKFDSWTLYEDVKERMPVQGVVEGVLDGTTVRVLLVPSFFSIVVRLAGVQSEMLVVPAQAVVRTGTRGPRALKPPSTPCNTKATRRPCTSASASRPLPSGVTPCFANAEAQPQRVAAIF